MLSFAVDLIPGARRRALMAANLGLRMVTRLEQRSLPNHRRADRSRLARPLVRKRDVDPTALRKFPISRGNPGAVRELCGIVGPTALRPDRGLSGWYGIRMGADDLWVLPKPGALRPGCQLCYPRCRRRRQHHSGSRSPQPTWPRALNTGRHSARRVAFRTLAETPRRSGAALDALVTDREATP